MKGVLSRLTYLIEIQIAVAQQPSQKLYSEMKVMVIRCSSTAHTRTYRGSTTLEAP